MKTSIGIVLNIKDECIYEPISLIWHMSCYVIQSAMLPSFAATVDNVLSSQNAVMELMIVLMQLMK